MSTLRPAARTSSPMAPPRDNPPPAPLKSQPSASQVASTTALTHPLEGRSVYECLPPVTDPTSNLPISPFRQQVLQHEQLLASSAVPSSQDRIAMMQMAASMLDQRMRNVRVAPCASFQYVHYARPGPGAAAHAARGAHHALDRAATASRRSALMGPVKAGTWTAAHPGTVIGGGND